MRQSKLFDPTLEYHQEKKLTDLQSWWNASGKISISTHWWYHFDFNYQIAVFIVLDWPIILILMYTQTVSPIIDQSAVYTPKLYLKNAVVYIREFRGCILGVKSYNKYNCIRMATLFTLTEISLKFRFIPKDELLFFSLNEGHSRYQFFNRSLSSRHISLSI